MDIELLLKELDKLSFIELLNLYIEAKTGTTEPIEEIFLPDVVELIYKLNEAVKLPEE